MDTGPAAALNIKSASKKKEYEQFRSLFVGPRTDFELGNSISILLSRGMLEWLYVDHLPFQKQASDVGHRERELVGILVYILERRCLQ